LKLINSAHNNLTPDSILRLKIFARNRIMPQEKCFISTYAHLSSFRHTVKAL